MINFSQRLLLLLALALIIQVTGNSQPEKKTQNYFKGFIIRNNGDSLRGYIELSSLQDRSKWLFFKRGLNGIDQQFYPSDLSALGSRNQMYRYSSINVPLLDSSELSFVRILVKGVYSVYFYKMLNLEHVLIIGPNKEVIDVTNPPWLSLDRSKNINLSRDLFKEILLSVFSNDPRLSASIENFRPDHRTISMQLIKYYEEEGMPYESYGIKNTVLIPGIIAGVTFDKLHPGNLNEVRSVTSSSPYVGINMVVKNSHSRIGYYIENSIALKSFHYTYQIKDSPITEYYEVFQKSTVNLTGIGINLTSWSNRRIDPVFETGIVLSSTLSSNSDNYKDILNENEDIVYSYLTHEKPPTQLFYGALMKGGICYNMASNKFMKFTAGYSTYWNNGKDILNSFILSVSYSINLK